VHGVDDVRQTEIHTAVRLVPEASAFEFEMCIVKLIGRKSTGIDQIAADMIKAEGRTIRSKIHKLINSIWNKEELPEEWKKSIIVPIYNKGCKRDGSSCRGISLLPATYKILYNILLLGDRGSTVVKVMRYKSEGRWFDPRWLSWNF
jgi:hypothetical protein